MAMELDSETQARLKQFADFRHSSPEAVLREALDQYMEGEVKPEPIADGNHPSGQPWPRRTPVGGIITPV